MLNKSHINKLIWKSYKYTALWIQNSNCSAMFLVKNIAESAPPAIPSSLFNYVLCQKDILVSILINVIIFTTTSVLWFTRYVNNHGSLFWTVWISLFIFAASLNTFMNITNILKIKTNIAFHPLTRRMLQNIENTVIPVNTETAEN